MDPDAALAVIRELAAEINEAGPDALDEIAAMRLADHVTGLDQWLTKGGFLPADWKP